MPTQEQAEWLRWWQERHPEDEPAPDVKRRLGIVQDEWQD